MKVLSLNVGLPRTVQWKGKPISTGIFKEPVAGRITLRTLNFDGDGQADPSAHGGVEKAAYAYPAEHYDYWRREFPEMTLPWGIFGENLTTEGLPDATLNLGARLRIGSAEVVVTQPRLPCYKLGIRFGRDDIIARLVETGRQGVYFRVAVEGEVAAGDEIVMLDAARDSVPLAEVTRLYARDKNDLDGMRRMVAIAALPEDWREYFEKQIRRRAGGGQRVHPTPPGG